MALAFPAYREISPIGELAFVDLHLAETAVFALEMSLAGGLVVAALVMVLPRFMVGVAAARLAAAVILGGLLATGLARMLLGGAPYSQWTLVAEAARYAVPLALLLLATKAQRPSAWILRIGIALTFAAHGREALAHTPRFVDLILIADGHVSGLLEGHRLFDEASARTLLTGIGAIDLGLAVLGLVMRSRALWLYMAFWGFLTAASRVLAGGLDWWPAALERLPNGAAPLALVLLAGSLARSPKSSDHAPPA